MHTIIHHDSTRLPLSHLSFVPGPTPGFSLTSYMTGVHRRREDSFLSASFAWGEHFGCRLQLCFQARSDWRSAQLVLYFLKKFYCYFLPMQGGMWDLSFLTKDQTCSHLPTPGIGSMESQTLKSLVLFFLRVENVIGKCNLFMFSVSPTEFPGTRVGRQKRIPSMTSPKVLRCFKQESITL